MSIEPYTCDEKDAAKIHGWLLHRGGILIWRSVNLSNPGQSWTTPATIRRGDCEGSKAQEGSPDDILPYPKPTWQAANQSERHITSAADVRVSTAKEVKRFHVATRMGGNGLSIKLTDASSRKLRSEVAKAHEQYGKDAWYVFDYGDYKNAVILIEDSAIPLTEWVAKHEAVGV